MKIFLHHGSDQNCFTCNNYCFIGDSIIPRQNNNILVLVLVNVTFIPVFKRAGFEEWRDKAVFLTGDGAAVNHGKKNGVAAKLKDDVGNLVSVHCVAHRLELGVTKATKDDAKLKRLNEVLSFLYEQYQYSTKALRELRMLGEELEDNVLKPTNLRGSHWMSYRLKAVKITTN